jgi:hypothetical protein
MHLPWQNNVFRPQGSSNMQKVLQIPKVRLASTRRKARERIFSSRINPRRFSPFSRCVCFAFRRIPYLGFLIYHLDKLSSTKLNCSYKIKVHGLLRTDGFSFIGNNILQKIFCLADLRLRERVCTVEETPISCGKFFLTGDSRPCIFNPC